VTRISHSAPLRSVEHPPNLRRVSKDDHIEFDGVVTEVLTGGMFRVKIDDDHSVIAHLAGKMRKFRIKVVLGDRVKVAVSPYDPNRGRIIYRVR
jgi:translation initiation factor IF-1